VTLLPNTRDVNMVTVRLENITHIYPGNVEAVKDVSITFLPTFNGLLGPSGCGKTTLMKIIAGLISPTKGRVYFNDTDVTDLSPQARNIAMVFQFPVVYDMSVYDNIAFPLRVRKVSEHEIRKKVQDVANFLNLKDVLEKNALKLDSNSKQRVAIARALVRDPNLFILDEPFSNVDPENRLVLRAKLKEIQKELKSPMIFVTHDQAEALTLSEMIAVMKEGRIIQYDTPEKIYSDPKDVFVAYFVGIPGMNILDCHLKDGKLKVGEILLDISSVKNLSELKNYGSEFILGIRAEHIDVRKTPMSREYIPMKCILVEDLGTLQLLYLQGKGINLKAKVSHDLDINEGDTVYVKLAGEYLKVFKKTGERIL